jgi:hypothetical protein
MGDRYIIEHLSGLSRQELSELAVLCLLQVGGEVLLHLEPGRCLSFGFFRVTVTHQLAQRHALKVGGLGKCLRAGKTRSEQNA